MLPVSSAFLAAVRSSHAIVSRARLITPGATGANPPGVDLALIEGTVTLDATADIRGTCDLTLAEPWPTAATTADLVPYGSELTLSRGVVFGNGAIERAPLGVYRIVTVEQDDAPAGPLRITGQDRMAGLLEATLTAPMQYLSSQTYADVLADLVTAVYPGAVIEWDDTAGTAPIGRTTIVEEDRHAFLADLVASLGKVWWWDYRGVLVVRDPPDPGVPVWQVDAGAGGVLVSASRSLSREGVFNAVVATGEAVDSFTPATAVVVDNDPASVTYWDGPFGKVPLPYSSPAIVTAAQATKAAAAKLAASRGLPYSVDLTAVPNPALEPLDAVRVVYPSAPGRPQRQEVHVLDQLRVPLSADGTLTATTRLQQTGGV